MRDFLQLKTRVVFIGRQEALADCAAAVAAAQAAGYEVVTCALDPATLGRGLFGRFRARRKLRLAAARAGEEGLVLLVERSGDAAWEPWMAYAAGAGLRRIAVPARLRGFGNIAGVRSGVAVYDRLETAADLDLICRAARAEVQALVSAVRF